ncbi:hypothetical protein K8I61_16855 [bacterium]|nr:hypothetical protein [bacterium]
MLNVAAVIAEVESGVRVVITRDGRGIVEMVPVPKKERSDEIAACQ